jgi:hypothetical protein
VQVFSIDDCTDLTVSGITIDGTAGDSLGANTDGFDIGDSTSVTISGANVYNQDDCVAVNSGTVSFIFPACSSSLTSDRISPSQVEFALEATVFPSVCVNSKQTTIQLTRNQVLSEAVQTTQWIP